MINSIHFVPGMAPLRLSHKYERERMRENHPAKTKVASGGKESLFLATRNNNPKCLQMGRSPACSGTEWMTGWSDFNAASQENNDERGGLTMQEVTRALWNKARDSAK